MRRRAILAAAVAPPACAHRPFNDSHAPIVQATARVMIASLAEQQSGQHGYHWDALSARISRLVHWHVTGLDARNRPFDSITRRNGWLEGQGHQVSISALGSNERVTSLEFEHNDAFAVLSLLNELREQGAEVSFQADYETYSEYLVTAPSRQTASLTARTSCSPFQARPAQGCEQTLSLAFEPPEY
jgi:hypothetical protein